MNGSYYYLLLLLLLLLHNFSPVQTIYFNLLSNLSTYFNLLLSTYFHLPNLLPIFPFIVIQPPTTYFNLLSYLLTYLFLPSCLFLSTHLSPYFPIHHYLFLLPFTLPFLSINPFLSFFQPIFIYQFSLFAHQSLYILTIHFTNLLTYFSLLPTYLFHSLFLTYYCLSLSTFLFLSPPSYTYFYQPLPLSSLPIAAYIYPYSDLPTY